MPKNHLAQKMSIALDFDGCIAIGEPVKIKYARLYHKMDIGPKTCMKATYPLGPVMYKQLMDKVMAEHTDEYILDPQCKEILDQLGKEGFDFLIITYREPIGVKTCREFIQKHKLPITRIYGTSDKSKKDLCAKFFVRAMIDDTLGKLLDLTELPIQLFFLQRDWNTHEKVSKEMEKQITPLTSWQEFAEKVREMKATHEAICFYKNIINSDVHLSEIHSVLKTDPFLAKRALQEYKREKYL
ncbi:hypothetical protein EXS74_00485 [Candidatus Woesearchaeota archaeon]|nr:hypothetical protein [Candidatus Woesearchaeota archaeon]